MTYQESLTYLYSFLNFEKVSQFSYRRELNLERMRMMLRWFQNPQHKFKSVLIAGTKGKGSTAFFLERLLSSHGFRTGLYTSPHLSDFRERIRIGAKLIEPEKFSTLVSKIRREIARNHKKIQHLGAITFFEISTLLAFLYFEDQKVDWAVLEVGMGGRLDATNVVRHSLSIITLIGMDHEEHLGSTLERIAAEKAAIIRSKSPVICARQKLQAFKAIQLQARENGAQVYLSGRDFKSSSIRLTPKVAQFNFQFRTKKFLNLTLRLPGSFQVQNASVALAAFCRLGVRYAFPVKEREVRYALQAKGWPGRLESFESGRYSYILDSAHNPESIKVLSDHMRKFFLNKRVITIFGVSREKNVTAIYPELRRISDVIILTRANQPRASDPKQIVEQVNNMGLSILSESLREAIACARQIADHQTVILITGSLFLVGEARKLLKCPMPI